MNALVTGGAGFIGRWVVNELLNRDNNVWVLDDLSNGREGNISEFRDMSNFKGLTIGNIRDKEVLKELFKNDFDVCYHLAASINVQDSIDDPETTFNNDVIGTFNVLEECRKYNTKIVFMSTCMVYDMADDEKGINEKHSTKPASPYAGSKIAGENLALSYWYAYKMPVVVLRPFNTYGPFQKSGGEGGVVAVFIKRYLDNKKLMIYGNGTQTRDFLYVEDCARFVVDAGYNDKVNGHIINAGSGRDIPITDLALSIATDESMIEYVEHIHPQSEIQKLLCDNAKAKELFGWESAISLEDGINRTIEWIKENPHLI